MGTPARASQLPPRNLLALASVPLALVFPLGVLLALVEGGVIYQTVIPHTTLLSLLGTIMVLAGMPAAVVAIAAGHVGLRRADPRQYQRPLRGVALLGLVLGYGSLVAVVASIVWVLVHGIRVHYVF